MAGTRYTFGDSDLAVDRIALVARVFEATSRRLLTDAVPRGVGLAVDLGCGPGHTTRLVAEVCRPQRTVGLDASPRYVAAATATTTDPSVQYAVHDVTTTPLPESPADLIYTRLLLAHLPDPLGLVERWRNQLAPAGVLVVDEIETMETPTGPLADYEAVVVALVAAEGGLMCAGPALAPLGGELVHLEVAAAVAAEMFAVNLRVWRGEAESRGLATPKDLDAMARGLATLRDRPSPPVRWTLRQLTLPAA